MADDWLEVSPAAAAGIASWDEHAGRFVDALANDTDERLADVIRAPWWTADAPRWRVVATVAIEMHHHGAEIGVLRDLYAKRPTA